MISYDIDDHLEATRPAHVFFNIGDVLKDPNLIKSDVILVDTFHDGDFENDLYQLIRGKFKGILIFDDIHLAHMKSFWQSITEPKEDLTNIGHYTGTGVVFFNGKKPKKRCNNCG